MRTRLRRFLDDLPAWAAWPPRERRVRWMLRSARKWRRKHPPRCYRCGFDLTGSRRLDTCPECGRACEWGAHWTRDGRWSLWLLRAMPVLAMLPFLVWIFATMVYFESTASSPAATLNADAVTGTGYLAVGASAGTAWYMGRMTVSRTRAFSSRERRRIAVGRAVAAIGSLLLLAMLWIGFVSEF